MQQRRLRYEVLEVRDLLAADVVISEFLASNQRTLDDGAGRSSDWIELFNAGSETADLAGWSLTDDPQEPRKWTFPAVPAVRLAPGDHLVVFASGESYPDSRDLAGHLHATFRLSADGEYLGLIDAQGQIRDQFLPSFPAQQTDISYGRMTGLIQDVLVDRETPAAVWVPMDSNPGPVPERWNQPDLMLDANWRMTEADGSPIRLPLGFDADDATAGAIAHWPLDGAQAQMIAESSGAHPGTMVGAAEFIAEGASDTTAAAVRLSGDGQRITVPYHANLNPASFTFAVWARTHTRLGFGSVVTNRFDSGSGDLRGFILYNDSQGRWSFWTGDGSAPWNTLVGPTATLNRWTHLAVSYDADTGTKQLFVDGALAASSTDQGYVPNTIRDLHLGAGLDDGSTYFFDGELDDAVLLDRALDGSEIGGLMQGTGGVTRGAYHAVLATDLSTVSAETDHAYVRVPFSLQDAEQVDRLELQMQVDDGVIAYVNGSEVARLRIDVNATELPVAASGPSPGLTETVTLDLSEHRSLLRDGDNLLSFFVANAPDDKSDLLIAPRLLATRHIVGDRVGYLAPPTPGDVNANLFERLSTGQVEFSEPSRTYVDPIVVALQGPAELPNDAIYYTLDGTEPTVASARYTAPLTITDSVQLRARFILPDAVPGPIHSASYLRLSSEVAARSSFLPITILDNHGAGAVPNAGWNQTNTGIQQVARQSASLMILRPDNDAPVGSLVPELASRAGIRVRGAFSSSFAEPGYSLEIWNAEDDTDTSLGVLGMEPAADWVLYSPNAQYDQALIDNTFMFDLQRQMGHWSPDYQYVELYLNRDGGAVTEQDYVGLYAWFERAERGVGRIDIPAFAPDGSAGGWILEINRMDSISEDGEPPKNFHTAGRDGVLRTPRDLSNSSGIGDDIPRQYNAYINFTHPNPRSITEAQRVAIETWFQRMEDVLWDRTDVAWNDPVDGYAKYIDVDSFIDYLILNNLSHNGDGLLLSMWLYNPDPAGDGKLTFGPIWDVDLGSFSGNATAELMRNADRLWYGRLFQDRDFAQRYVDRWHELRQGPLRNDNLVALIESLYEKIGEDAAARDGVNGWRRRLDSMQTWVTRRADAIDASHTALPTFDPPPGEVPFGTQLRAAIGAPDIYVTTDGSDPRAPGGTPGTQARLVTELQTLPLSGNVTLQARSVSRNRWSPLTEVTYRVLPPDPNDLNLDGLLNHDDLALACQGFVSQDAAYDRNGDGRINVEDLAIMLESSWNTGFGDTDLNGVFDSTDLVQAFVYGRYEGNLPATWISGDRNCDGRFTTADLVLAFSSGGYEAPSPSATAAGSPSLSGPHMTDLALAAWGRFDESPEDARPRSYRFSTRKPSR